MKYIFLTPLLLLGCTGMGTYEGLSAQEWYNEYQYAQSSLEDAEMLNQDLQNELADTADELYDANAALEEMKDCVLSEVPSSSGFSGFSDLDDVSDELQRLVDAMGEMVDCVSY